MVSSERFMAAMPMKLPTSIMSGSSVCSVPPSASTPQWSAGSRRCPNSRHAVEHLAELLQVGFARRVVDCRGPLGQHGGHHDVGRAGYGCLIEQHVGAAQLVGLDHEEVVGDVEIELRAELLESQEVGVEAPASDFVAARAE